MKLAKALAAAVLMSCATLAGAADADPPAVIGRLNDVSGPVSFAPAQANEDWTAAGLNRPITTGDRLWTDAGGRAEMHVGSLAIRMDSRTSLDVLKLDEDGQQLRLAQGGANLRVRRAAADQPIEIATPGGAVVLKQPGSYRVNVDPQSAATTVAVRAGGPAEVFAANGSFVVSNGQQATIGGSRQDLAAAPAPDEFDRWAATRDQREDRVASTRYVPAEMTGYEDLDSHGSWRTVPEYGPVWQPTTVPAGWAPYRYGHWVWVAPWGWTWVDDAPWGFAPSHYGRWVWLGGRWAWAPGRIVARPVYAPALVAFIGGPNFSVSIGVGSAPAVGWVPLGWHEPYRPWYHASPAHLREVNVTNVTNVTNITNVTNVRYVNRSVPSAVTVVSRENFVAARSVQPAALRVSARTIAAAPVTSGSPVAAPSRTSLAQGRPGARPPAGVRTREAVAVSAPPAPARAALRDGADKGPRAGPATDGESPRVRVIARQERVNPAQREPQRVAEKQAQPNAQPQSASVRERAPEKAEARARQSEQRAPAPPAEVTARPTFDRSGRAQQLSRREEAQKNESQPLAQESQRQPAQEQQERRQAEAQRQRAQQDSKASQQQAQPLAQEQARQHAQQQAQQQQQQAQQQEAQHARQQTQQQARAEQQTQQRAQQQAQQQKAQQQEAQRARQQTQQQAQAEQQAQQRARQQAQQQQAQQHAQERARQQQEAQGARQQAQQQARAEQQAHQRAQQQTQQQQAQQRAQQQAHQHEQQQTQQQRPEQKQEKGGRDHPRAEKAEKAEKG